ncbi:hypothetical protein IU409_12560 [Nocardia cyriacigeorgica]|uniref:HEPN domain-containing protein n=1 Tax=Nocardia cyriacigeorgica TaxID=135487 RepID=UPI0018961071|nr:HEPN domain-containing protein [Nocardia cyriacigeorgica]MBF6344335.1 hypothetical protein [Nocardia cyriacigeorgica]
MPESADSVFDPVSEENFVELLRNFSIDALELLRATLGTPRFYRPRYMVTGRWRRDENDPEILRRKPLDPVWEYDFEQTIWADWNQIRLLKSYTEICQSTCRNLTLHRRIRIAFKAAHEERSIAEMDTASGLDLMLQDHLLLPMVNSSKSFDFNEQKFQAECAKITDRLADMRIKTRRCTPLRFTYGDTVTISEDCIIRKLTDDEIETGESFGILPLRHTPTGWTSLLIQHQLAIVQERSVSINLQATDTEFEQQIRKATKDHNDTISDIVTAAINILCEKGSCERGESWTTLQTSSSKITWRDGDEYPGMRKYWRTASCNLDEIPSGSLADLVSDLQKPIIKQHLTTAVDRFSTAVNRISDEEAIVDLAIAAESIFGAKSSGETTFKTSLNAGIFLGGNEASGSEVRKFIQAVYSTRSRIVHGQSRPMANNAERTALEKIRTKLTQYIRTSILKAAHALAEDSDALNWNKHLDAMLDSRS